MGCDLLALDLGTFLSPPLSSSLALLQLLIPAQVRNWEFLLPAPTVFKNLGGEPDPRQMMRRRSSLVVADLPLPQLPLDMKSGGIHKPPPSVFEEPESSSLLDNFGF